MPFVHENVKVELFPGTPSPIVYLSENDVGDTLAFELVYKGQPANIPRGSVVKFKGTKKDGLGFTVNSSNVSGNVVSFIVSQDMTSCSGMVEAEISITLSNNKHGTCNVALIVEKNPHSDGTQDGSYPQIVSEMRQLVEQIEGDAETASSAADTAVAAKNSALEIQQDVHQYTASAIDDWLDNHPEATTTVQDGSLTYKKLVTGTLGFVTPEMFGAKGDGETNDTPAIQAAIETGKPVIFENNKTYLLYASETQEKAKRYALSVPSNTILDLNGATLKLANNQNCCLLINADIVTVNNVYGRNTDITIINGIIDGNCDNQEQVNVSTSVPTVLMWGADRLNFYNLTIRNAYCAALYLRNTENSFIDNVSVKYAIGCGISVIAGYSYCIGSVIVEDVNKFPVELSGFYGNSFIGTFYNTYIGSVISINSYWGVKIQDGSTDVHVGSIIATGGNYTDYDTITGPNAGIKIQGLSDVIRCNNIKIDSITVRNYSTGLYVYASNNVDIKSYTGVENGYITQATTDYKSRADVYINLAKNINIDFVYSCDSYYSPIWLQDNNDNIIFNTIVIRRTGDVTPVYSNALVRIQNTTSVKISSIRVVEEGTWNNSIVVFFAGTSSAIVEEIEGNITPNTSNPLFLRYSGSVGYFEVRSVRFNGQANSGMVTIPYNASGRIENVNIFKDNGMHPIIILTPYNIDALTVIQDLGYRIYPESYTSGTGATIYHSPFDSALNPQFIWKLLGYISVE